MEELKKYERALCEWNAFLEELKETFELKSGIPLTEDYFELTLPHLTLLEIVAYVETQKGEIHNEMEEIRRSMKDDTS